MILDNYPIHKTTPTITITISDPTSSHNILSYDKGVLA
jgi:hypothetical protein